MGVELAAPTLQDGLAYSINIFNSSLMLILDLFTSIKTLKDPFKSHVQYWNYDIDSQRRTLPVCLISYIYQFCDSALHQTVPDM